MKIHFKSLAFSLVLLGTTFCSKDPQSPGPTATGNAETDNNVAASIPNPGPPVGFNPQTCSADSNGVDSYIYNEARNNAYANGATVADVDAAKAAALYNSSTVIDANGHVSANATPYASRVNNFSDGVKAQIDEYDYYVHWASLHGSQVENEADVKSIIQEQFDLAIPVQPNENATLSQATKDDITLLTSAVKPQLDHALQLFSSEVVG